MRDVTGIPDDAEPEGEFLLTRPMRDVTLYGDFKFLFVAISTHTSHAGRDPLKSLFIIQFIEISTHTSHAGRDMQHPDILSQGLISTHTSHAGRDV